MSGFLNILNSVFSRINLVCAGLGAALLFFIATIICFEVVIRAFGGASRLWVIEVSEYSLLFITFLGAPYLLEKNKHVVLDLIYTRLSDRKLMLVQLLNSSIGFLVCAMLTIVGLQVVVEQFTVGVREVTVMRPQSWWITAALPLGMFLMSAQFLFHILRTFRGEEI